MAIGDRAVPESAWRLRKAKSLIKLLALTADGRMHRERAGELLWPDRTTDSAANNLHQALYVARRALEAAGADALECLALRDDMLVLSEERPVEIDAAEFEQAAEAARAMSTTEAYRDALALYGGELLPEDRYEDWAAGRREALRELHLALLLELAEQSAGAGDAAGAVEALQRAVVDDPLHEEAHRRLMRLFAEAGRRQQALAQYQQLRQTLRREYAADPDPETRRLFQDILAGRFDPVAPTEAPAESRPPGARRGLPRTGAAPGHNLPVQLTSFVGRERELAELRGQLDRSRLVTLTGPGGAGKTRLALEVAAERLRDYDNGVWLVELAALADPGLVAQETAVVLGMQLHSRDDAGAALARLIGDRRLLLLLDNCEHLIGSCARLAEELLRACPALTLLATSREPLRIGGEVTVRVPSLGLPDPELEVPARELMRFESIRLFAERAADAAPGFRLTDKNASEVADVCFRLDGMPLAIELAAARAAVLTPAQMAARLRDSLDLLGGGRGRLTRQQTLAATLHWSHDLLTPPERVLFRRTGVFAGSFGLDAVEEVCGGGGLEPGGTLELLGRLVDKSLTTAEEERGEYRYRLLETIRQFARERLAEAGETAGLEARHRSWALAVAEAADPQVAGERFFERAEVELDNLRAALASALRNDPRCALRIAVALWPLWMRRGYFSEGSRLLEAALAADPAPTPLRARGLVAASALEVRLARPERIISLAEEARGIHAALHDSRAVAGALLYRGVLETTHAQYAAARETLEEAFAQAQQVGDALVAAGSRHAQGVVAHARGHDDKARWLMQEGLDLLPAAPDSDASVWATTHRPRDRPRWARANAHVLRGHPAHVPRGRRRGGEGLHAVRLRAGRAGPGRLRRRARGAGSRPDAAPRARRPPRDRGRTQRSREPGALPRAVRAGPRMAGGGAHDPPRHGRPASHRDDLGVLGSARRPSRAPGGGAPAHRARAGNLRRGRGRAGQVRNAPQPGQPRARGGRGGPRPADPGGNGRAVSQPDDHARLGLAHVHARGRRDQRADAGRALVRAVCSRRRAAHSVRPRTCAASPRSRHWKTGWTGAEGPLTQSWTPAKRRLRALAVASSSEPNRGGRDGDARGHVDGAG